MDDYNKEIEHLKYLRQESYDAYCKVAPVWFIGLLISVFGLVSVVVAIITSILIWKILAISMIIIGYILTVILSLVAGIFQGQADLLEQEIDRMIWDNLAKKVVKL